MNETSSSLTECLANMRTIEPKCEHEIDLLRKVYLGEIGTAPQRNALIRIVHQNKPRRNLMTKLMRAIGVPVATLPSTYINR